MKATLPSGKHGVVTVDLKAEAKSRRVRVREAAPGEVVDVAHAETVEPPVLWTEELPPPPHGHDDAGRNAR